MSASKSDEVKVSRRSVIAGAAAAGMMTTIGLGRLAGATGSQKKRLPLWVPEDKYFGAAFIDKDEWRHKPTRFRYVHGGFEGTDTRFSFYLPPLERYQGRFFHPLAGKGGTDDSVLQAIDHYDQFGVVPPLTLLVAFDNGAYLVESNQGHIGSDISKTDQTVMCWRASAESAKFARIVAQRMYGSTPNHGYVFGGSGGAARTFNCLERVEDVWSAGVPFVAPHESSGTFFSVLANAVRLLGPDKIARVSDAVEVGGSGKPFQGLNSEQIEALEGLYKSGYPRGIGLENPAEQVLVWSYRAWMFEQFDPTYFEDFWNKVGYMGHDNPQALERDRLLVRTRVRHVLTGAEFSAYKPLRAVVDERGQGRLALNRLASAYDRPVALVIDAAPELLAKMGCSSMFLTSGAAKDRERFVYAVNGDALLGGGIGSDELFEGVKPGDEITIDNRKYLAFCYHHRHQAEPRYREWAHLLVDGKPIYPQRPKLKQLETYYPYTHRIPGKKLIIVQNMLDRGTYPSGAAAHRDEYAKVMGGQWVRDNLRIWYNDHAWHGGVPERTLDEKPPVFATRLVDYQGSVHRALHELVQWVEQGKEPPPDTKFEYTTDCAIVLPKTAAERRGVQPVVDLMANGERARLEVITGETVEFIAIAEVPPGAGAIVAAEWDYDGSGHYPFKHTEIDGKSAKLELRAHHVYDRPGTYFACVRVTSQADGDLNSPLYRLPNLGRIRIIVVAGH